MPEQGLDWLSRDAVLTFEEMHRLCQILAVLGINKVRLTGGEPFARKDFMTLLRQLAGIAGLQELTITSNGVLILPHIARLKELGVRSVNLSLDTLDRGRFHQITRRDELPQVIEALHGLLLVGINVRVNAVVMAGKNENDIVPLAKLAEQLPIDIRFIEEMPFNGGGGDFQPIEWDHVKILGTLRAALPPITPIVGRHGSTASNYSVQGYAGRVGIIAAYSRTFCGTCNRLRITPQGMLKTCLYDAGVLDLRSLLRSGANDADVSDAIKLAVAGKARDGHQAAAQSAQLHSRESMATIGG
jgi:molybdenum cofactor biosynthesis enzyme MoaA